MDVRVYFVRRADTFLTEGLQLIGKGAAVYYYFTNNSVVTDINTL